MSVLSQRMEFEPLRSLDFSTIGGTYMGIGTALDHPARQIFIQNLTDIILVFSKDGINDHLALPSNGFFLDDITSNRTERGGIFCMDKGDRLYVKELIGILPTSGAVYFTVIYAD